MMTDATNSKLVQDVMDAVGSLGMPYPSRPQEMPEMPADLSTITSEELSRLMGQFSALIAYAQVKVAEADTFMAAKKSKYEIARASTYLALKADERMTEKQREYSLEVNKDLMPLKREYVQAEQVYELTKALLSGYQQKYAVLSRELTRRGVSAERGYA